jgi:class 3 adenylate cyclase
MALAPGAPAPRDLRKVVTVVFCDLVGSTSLGERLDPEALRQVITRYFEAMRDALERHGGSVAKFIGDAVMAVFGVPTVREDDALRAVRAAADTRTALAQLNGQLEARWGVRLCIRIGVNTGEVTVGDQARGHGFAIGDAVNVAARLEQAAAPGEILIGEHTLALVRDAVRVESVPPLALKGKSELQQAFRLIEVAEHAAVVDRRLDSPLVGRERELAVLREALDRAIAERRCEMVTLVGTAGVGKSRLAQEFAGTLHGEARALSGRCLSYGAGLTFWPLRQVVNELAGTDDGEPADAVKAKIARLLLADPEGSLVVERVAGALGLSDATAYLPETFWAVRKLLEAAAAQQPLVVIFEDVQWAETAFLDLIEQVAGAIQGVAILIVAVGRTDVFDVKPDFARAHVAATSMELRPLSSAESRALIEHLIGDAGVVPDVARRVFAAAEGNPLFIEELVRMLVEERHMTRDEEGLSWVADSSRVSVPPTIQALLAARLDRLDPAERAVVDTAAVIGRSFARGAVLELSQGADACELDRHLHALECKQLIEADDARLGPGGTFSFKHILIRDVAYQGSLKQLRSDLHERYADWLERMAGDRASEHGEILGHHLERAVHYLTELGPLDRQGRELAVRAAAWLGFSGRRALARGENAPAVALLERAVSFLPDDDPARRELSLKLGIALAEAGKLTRADALLHDRIEAEQRGRTFVVFHDATGQRCVVDLEDDAAKVSVGRRVENDVALSWDAEVSRHHADLLRLPQGWALVDSESRNGSHLNGERVSGRRLLRDGDVLRFGDTVVLFRAPAADEEPRPAAAARPEELTSLRERLTDTSERSETDRG